MKLKASASCNSLIAKRLYLTIQKDKESRVQKASYSYKIMHQYTAPST